MKRIATLTLSAAAVALAVTFAPMPTTGPGPAGIPDGVTVAYAGDVAAEDAPTPLENTWQDDIETPEPEPAADVDALVAETLGTTEEPEELWPAVNTFEEAAAQCEELSKDDQQLSDCVNSAIIAWCEFVPFTPESPHYDPEVDGPCLEDAPPAEPEEDEASFDCRVHGNDVCGVTIGGDPYTITFKDGAPVAVSEGLLTD